MKRIKWQGHFVSLLSGLAAGEPETNPNYGLIDLHRDLCALDATGMARKSRRGWSVIDHPLLGQISWKSGRDFRTALPYLFVRVAGRQVLAAWPDPGHTSVSDPGRPALGAIPR